MHDLFILIRKSKHTLGQQNSDVGQIKHHCGHMWHTCHRFTTLL